MHRMIVKSWMSKKVVTVRPETPLIEACDLLHAHNIRHLPVVDEAGRLIGIVTRGDLREAWPTPVTSLMVELNKLLEHQPVANIMTRHPITVTPETSMEQAARTMLDKKIGALPVLDEAGNLVGILSDCDIFRLVAQRQSQPEPA